LQTWIKRQMSALSEIGPELEKTQDGPVAEDLEVSHAVTDPKDPPKLSFHTEPYCIMSRWSWAGCWMMP
jgi:hypothetical protein